jgi:hypothetical protein
VQHVPPTVWAIRVLLLVLLVAAGFGIIKKHVSYTAGGTMLVSSDVLAYVSAADNMVHGRDIFVRADGESNSYVYPPFLAFLCIPLTVVPPLAVDILWFTLNLVLIAIVIRQSTVVFQGTSFSALSRRDQWSLAAFGILLSLRYLVRNAQDANINIVLLSLILGGLYLMRTRSNPAWGALIGIAAAIKILPAVFVVYFLARREWKAIAYLLGAFVVASVLPIVLTGPEKLVEYMSSFSAYSQSQFTPRGLEIENFSIWGFLGRIFSHNKAFDGAGGIAVFVNLVDLPLPVLRVSVYLINLLFLVVLYRVGRRESADNGRGGTGGIVLCLLVMNLVSILTEDHHTVAFMVAYMYVYLYQKERGEKGHLVRNVAVISGVLSLLLSHDVVVPIFGRDVYNVMLSYSLPVLPVGLTLFALAFFALRHPTPST